MSTAFTVRVHVSNDTKTIFNSGSQKRIGYNIHTKGKLQLKSTGLFYTLLFFVPLFWSGPPWLHVPMVIWQWIWDKRIDFTTKSESRYNTTHGGGGGRRRMNAGSREEWRSGGRLDLEYREGSRWTVQWDGIFFLLAKAQLIWLNIERQQKSAVDLKPRRMGSIYEEHLMD